MVKDSSDKKKNEYVIVEKSKLYTKEDFILSVLIRLGIICIIVFLGHKGYLLTSQLIEGSTLYGDISVMMQAVLIVMMPVLLLLNIIGLRSNYKNIGKILNWEEKKVKEND